MEYIKNNLDMVVLILCISIVVIYLIYRWINNKEGFETVGKDDNFKNLFEGRTRKVNFKCKIGDKEYYLITMRLSDCDKITNPTIIGAEFECSSIFLGLMEASELENKLKDYLKELEIQKQLCNYEKKLRCEAKNNTLKENETKEICSDINEQCEFERMFIHDFIVTEYSEIDAEEQRRGKKYIMKGTPVGKLPNIQNTESIINIGLFNTQQRNLVCGDITENFDEAKFMVIETPVPVDGGIAGGGTSPVSVKFVFESQLRRNGVPIFKAGGKPEMMQYYLGVCKHDKCKGPSEGKEILRVCLYDNPSEEGTISLLPNLVN